MRLFIRLTVTLLCFFALPAAAEMVLNRSGGSDPSSLDPQKATGNTAVPILNELFVGLKTSLGHYNA